MTRFAAFVAGLAAVACPATSIPAQEGRAEPVLYYPTRVGAKWTYEFPDADLTLVVTKVDRKGDTSVVSVARVWEGGAITPYEKVEVSGKGLFRLESITYRTDPDGRGGTTSSERMVDESPPVCLLKLPATPGRKWEAKPGGDRPMTLAAGRPEAVRVPAGRFTAVPVDVTIRWPLSEPLQSRYWYAPGVGPVKWTTLDGDEVVLKAFTPGRP